MSCNHLSDCLRCGNTVEKLEKELSEYKILLGEKVIELMNRDKVVFIIDGHHRTSRYNIKELLLYDEEAIIENEENCDCDLNESVNCCEGDCVRFEHSSITGWEFVV